MYLKRGITNVCVCVGGGGLVTGGIHAFLKLNHDTIIYNDDSAHLSE